MHHELAQQYDSGCHFTVKTSRNLNLPYSGHVIGGITGAQRCEYLNAIAGCRNSVREKRTGTNTRPIPWQLAHKYLASNFDVTSLESTAGWGAFWTYSELEQLPHTDTSVLPVCLEHERLVLDRAQYIVDILQRYLNQINVLVSGRLSEYSNFIDVHSQRVRLYEELSPMYLEAAGGNPLPGPFTLNYPEYNSHGLNIHDIRAETQYQNTWYPDTTATLLRPNTQLTGPTLADYTDPSTSTFDPNYRDDESLASIVQSAGSVHPPAQQYRAFAELSDLLERDDDQDGHGSMSHPRIYPSSTHGHHPESSAYSYNDRIKGKMPMNTDGSAENVSGGHRGKSRISEPGSDSSKRVRN
ncbi:hypothetical protein SeLEV6574_g08364 [Synchytrium endobioticum]|uniref:Uncharacterized protein n=1 Tax=Synchytrium endobioticum TaxID=286115 RepID=A0A507C7Z5_9FUNG|nr:hypothetical protein SeLEV6574_g08364 [Synchytrium endobioticum]